MVEYGRKVAKTVAYSELVKNFGKIRDYMRQFYVYGFRSRSEYDAKSARSYDNERRRMESWLGDHMSFRKDADGKRVFLSVDSRSVSANPLYNAFKAKSFTSGDITFHFYILDLLADGSEYSLNEIMELFLQRYISRFRDARELDQSTVRKKLKEYTDLGILESEKRGRELVYRRSKDCVDLQLWKEAISFYSEENPLGVVGSYLLDKYDSPPDILRFKHHYILHAIDSQVLYDILSAIDETRNLELSIKSRRGHPDRSAAVFPLKIYISTQTGRQYLLCRDHGLKRFLFVRLDSVVSVKPGEPELHAEEHMQSHKRFSEHLWGVSSGSDRKLERIEFTVHAGEGEGYIVNRLYRERRCGTVSRIGPDSYVYTADVYDAYELMPWLRTFIGRIESLTCSNQLVCDTFRADMEALAEMYGGERDALQ